MRTKQILMGNWIQYHLQIQQMIKRILYTLISYKFIIITFSIFAMSKPKCFPKIVWLRKSFDRVWPYEGLNDRYVTNKVITNYLYEKSNFG